MALSPTSSHGGGGSSPVITRAQYSGGPVSIADGSSGSVTWNTLNSGTALLDLTTPALPTVVTAGVYAVTVVIEGSALTIGGSFVAALDLDAAGDDPQIGQDSASSKAGHQSIITSLSMTYYIPAGGGVIASIGQSRDGASARNFSLYLAVVQRLS